MRDTMIRVLRKSLFAIFTCLCILLWMENDGEAAAQGLFKDHPKTLSAADASRIYDPSILRSRLVAVDFNQLTMADSGASSPSLALNLFPDASFTVVIDKIRRNSSGSLSWIGRLQGIPLSSVTLVVSGNMLVGNISMIGSMYQIRHFSDGGVHVIHQIDQSKLPPDGEPIVPPRGFADSRETKVTTQADDSAIIDVLVVYTATARTTAGSASAMNALIDLAETETNVSFSNSGINTSVRVVRREEVTYSETNFSFSQALSDVTNGSIPNVSTLRDTYGADVVVLLVKGDNSLCGLSWLMDPVSSTFESKAFSVTQQNCATGSYTFGHEIGHNMSARHDRASDNTDSPFAYNHGYVDSLHGFRTVMASTTSCTTCTRIQYWSNPNVSYLGNPVGVAVGSSLAADNRKTLNTTASTVANFRTSVSSGCTANSAVTNQFPSTLASARNFRIVSPYWQTNPGSYSFITVSHPSLYNTATQIGVVVSAVLSSGAGLYGSPAEFTITPDDTKRIFIVRTNHPTLNPTNQPTAAFISGNNENCFGQLVIAPKATNPTRQDVSTLSVWGAIVSAATASGFAMEFIGDLADSKDPVPTNLVTSGVSGMGN